MNTNLDIRVYPIDEPKGNTLAFANVTIDDMAVIRGVRVVSGERGLFATMPQTQDRTGIYHDIAFPLDGDLRKEIGAAVIDEYISQASLEPEQRGYENTEAEGRNFKGVDDVSLEVKVYPLTKPKGKTNAFASVALNETMAIRGIRIQSSDRGDAVLLPQSKDKDGDFHDVVTPLSNDLRKAIIKAVQSEYRQVAAERKQGLGERLAEGIKRSAEQMPRAPLGAVAKSSPGLGD